MEIANMEFRRWLPYHDIQTRHLRLLLATARVIAWIGMLLIAAGIAYGVSAGIERMGADAADRYAALTVGTVIGLVGYGLAAEALAGILAALVAIEESQRRRVEKE
jgi:uncharacterized membrane protein required for colicin V production